MRKREYEGSGGQSFLNPTLNRLLFRIKMFDRLSEKGVFRNLWRDGLDFLKRFKESFEKREISSGNFCLHNG